MSSSNPEFDAMLAKLRKLPELAKEAAPAVADAVRASFDAQIKAGTSPDGEPWKPTKEGTQPLQHASKALYVAAVGSTVLARLTGPEARHSLGRARGGIRRAIFPDQGIPNKMAAAIKDAVVKEFNELIGGKP